MILSRKYSVGIADLFCDEPCVDTGSDVVRYNFFSRETAGARISPYHTIWIDLTRPADELIAEFDKDTRKEIRRAERDHASAEIFDRPTDDVLAEFCEAYNGSVAVKGLPEIGASDFAHLVTGGILSLSRVTDQSGPVLAWHCYCRENRRCVLTHSVSMHRAAERISGQAIGRSNRYLHWQDILHFQTTGTEVMDMGGWQSGGENPELLSINRFKEAFGGNVVASYNSLHPITLKGRGALKALELKRLLANV